MGVEKYLLETYGAEVLEGYQQGTVFFEETGHQNVSLSDAPEYIKRIFGSVSYGDCENGVFCEPVGFFQLRFLDQSRIDRVNIDVPLTLHSIKAFGEDEKTSALSLAREVQKGMNIGRYIPKPQDCRVPEIGKQYKQIGPRSLEHDHDSPNILNFNVVVSGEGSLFGSVDDKLSNIWHTHLVAYVPIDTLMPRQGSFIKFEAI